jgi:type II secretory pathway pseudopilin PulG
MNHPAKTSRRPPGFLAGFTLTELLIVITIVIVLASIVFLMTGRMKQSALKVKELSNIRNISQVILTYHTDRSRLPGPVNRGIRMPSRVDKASRDKWLSTVLVDEGFLVNDDGLWQTSVSAARGPDITYVLNSTSASEPTYFFGKHQGGVTAPRSTMALKANIKASLGGRVPQDISQIWMVATADDENYGEDPLISAPVANGIRSSWGGRFYSYFDGRVEYVKRQTPSVYPSSWSGNHK